MIVVISTGRWLVNPIDTIKGELKMGYTWKQKIKMCICNKFGHKADPAELFFNDNGANTFCKRCGKHLVKNHYTEEWH